MRTLLTSRERATELEGADGGRPPTSRARKAAIIAAAVAVVGASIAGVVALTGSDGNGEGSSARERERAKNSSRTTLGGAPGDQPAGVAGPNGSAATKKGTKSGSSPGSGSNNPVGTNNASPPVGTGNAVELGVYAGSPGLTNAFGAWLGRAPKVVTAYLPGDSWAQIDNPAPWIDPWRGAPWKMTFAVPMFVPGGSLQEGAAGQYDTHFKQLGAYLVSRGWGNSSLRIGWEFNGNWTRWRAKPDPTAWVAYWRKIVTAMRSVPGASFKFEWNPLSGQQEQRAAQVWPGDAYVDFVAVNIYDTSWAPNTYPIPPGSSAKEAQSRREDVWDDKLNGVDGLKYWAKFAEDHGKKLTVPEWGVAAPELHGGGDNPHFITQMHKWISDNNLAYQSYFNADGSLGDHRLTGATLWPAAAAKFRQLFG